MAKQAPGAKAKSLGAELRAIRRDRKLTLLAVTDQLGWSESTLSRLETGKRNVESEDVASLLAVYQVTGSEREQLLAMARTPDQPGWLQATASGLTATSVTLATYEADATKIVDWSPLLIPGLLQTMEYGRAHMLADGIPEDGIGARLMARQRRQERLSTVDYTAYLWEPVLRNQVGGRRVMTAQLRSLQEAVENGTTVRVIPGNVGACAALVGPFVLLETPGRDDVVHVELSRSGVFLTGNSDVDHYKKMLDRLSEVALDPSQSTRLIGNIARDEEDG